MPRGLTMSDVPRRTSIKGAGVLSPLLEMLCHEQLSPTANVSARDVRLLLLPSEGVYFGAAVFGDHAVTRMASPAHTSWVFTLPCFPEAVVTRAGSCAPAPATRKTRLVFCADREARTETDKGRYKKHK